MLRLTILFLLATTIFFSCSEKPTPNPMVNETKVSESNIAKPLSKTEKMAKVSEGNQVPNGQLIDFDSTVTNLNAFRNKALVIDFWASWCSPCLEQVPIFKELVKEYDPNKVKFISVSIDEPYAFWKKFVADEAWQKDSYWIGPKEDNPISYFTLSEMELDSSKYIGTVLPNYVIISEKGEILSNKSRHPSQAKFLENLAAFK